MRNYPLTVAPVLAGLLLSSASAGAFEPTARYREETLRGFTVRLSPEVTKRRTTAAALLREVDVEFARIERMVPEKALKILRTVTVWFEWDAPADRDPVARFFPGSRAVKSLGLNPGKANAVEVPNVERFLQTRQAGAEWVVMHELAHAYHHLALGRQDGDIQTAFKQAVERRLYDNVEHFNGVRTRGYAVTNHYEYYATLTEAYFGKSFNFPYDRGGLLRYDTAGYWLMKQTWEQVK